MAGLKGKLKYSLQFRLSAGLSIVVAAVALAAGALAFGTAYQEAIELQDQQLRQMAALIGPRQAAVAPVGGADADDDPETSVAVQFLGAASGDLPGLPASLPDGVLTVRAGGNSWRVCVRTLAPEHRVAVGQRTVVREEIARDSAMRAIAPLLFVIPALLLLVAYLIRTMFRPLRQAAAGIDRRSEDDLAPIIDGDWPTEVRPFLVAINRLLAKVAESVAARERFVADAAHELRSPLGALSLQAEALAAAEMSGPARERLTALRQGILRARNLLEQLLTLVRVQGTPPPRPEQTSVRQVIRQVLEDLLPLAEAKDIDLGLLGEGDCAVLSGGNDLLVLVRNLLDNAIRYTPAGGRIDITVREEGGGGLLRIDDSGPGIPEAERQRVFDPFYRVPGSGEVGSGLGLSIVRTIAARMRAEVRFDNVGGGAGTGLRVEVLLPRPTSRA